MKAASLSRPLWRDCAVLLLVAAIPALVSGFFHPKRPLWSWSPPEVIEVDLQEVNRWSPAVLWIDARAAEAYERDHIPGAIVLNEPAWDELLPEFLAAWQPGKKVVVYCDSETCDASHAVARRLQRELNLTDVYVLKGGWTTWKARAR